MKYARTRKLILKTIEAAEKADIKHLLATGSPLLTLEDRIHHCELKRLIWDFDMNAGEAAAI